MGEARRRALARKQLNSENEQVILPRLSAALRKLTAAASSQCGADCYIHATIAQAVLSKLGIEAMIHVGGSAWRVGDGDSDVIVHAYLPNMVPQPGGVPYHVWLEVGDYILDFSTHSLPLKAAQLDALDGGSTNVTWHPDYLFVPKCSISTFREVTQLHAGLYYYERDLELEKLILDTAPEFDFNAVQAAWILYNNMDLQVFGPNSMEK